jgi:acyl-CoA thioesterase
VSPPSGNTNPPTEADQSLAERVVTTMMERDAFSRWLGIEILDVRPRGATIRMVVRDEMLNGFGVCHGGALFSLADSALAFACNTHGRVTVSIENSITYPTAIRTGDELTADAIEESATRRLAFYRVEIRRGGAIVSIFRGTVYNTEKPFFAPSA